MQHHLSALAAVLAAAVCLGQPRLGLAQETSPDRPDRAGSLQALCGKLGIGPGATIADIGCGKGQDSFTLATVVGANGSVFAEDIDPGKLKVVLEGAKQRTLPQVVPILGQSDDPRLPNGLVDLIYMHYVFHHFSQPRAMLRKMWLDLKPGGFLAIADRVKGPLRDWVPMVERQEKHHWTGETTVVRLAREEGFQFVDVWDDLWFEEEAFLLVFQRPPTADAPRGDPALQSCLEPNRVVQSLSFLSHVRGVVLVALDAGRELLPALRQRIPAGTPVYDVVLEEWATCKEELPAGADTEWAQVIRTDKEGLALPEDAVVDVVLFVNAYHRLWAPATILGNLGTKMAVDGRLVIMDRQGPDGELRRLANHRRRISPSLVRQELEQAGFRLIGPADSPASGMFLLTFAIDPARVPPTPETSGCGESTTEAAVSEALPAP